jgi:acetolactate synthase-1/2/3 large subunit
VHYAEAGRTAGALAELIPAPVAATNPGKSAIAESHPLALGASTRSSPKMYYEFLERADLVLAIGSSLTKTVVRPGRCRRAKKIIHSTNDPSDINKDHRAEIGLVGDAALVIDALIEEIGRQKQGGRGAADALAAMKPKSPASRKPGCRNGRSFLDSDEVPINQYRVIRDLLRTVDRDNVIITMTPAARASNYCRSGKRPGRIPTWALGQIDAIGLWPGPRHGRQAGGAGKTLHQCHGRQLLRHERHGYRDRLAQRIGILTVGLQQRRDGLRAACAGNVHQEIRAR